jgi:hypothetical protein
MATIEQVRNAMRRVPFRPFAVRLVDWRHHMVKHPDFISVPDTPRGRDLVIHDRGTHHVDILLVVEVDIADEAETTVEGNGD